MFTKINDNTNSSLDDQLINSFFNNSLSTYCTVNSFSNTIINSHHINNSKNPLSILHINARSIFNKMNTLELLCEQFKYFFNLIIVTESWLTDDTAKLINLNNYNFVYKNRAERLGGGVGIFVKHGLEFTVIDDDGFEGIGIDTICINIRSTHLHNRFEIRIIAIYRPPNSNFDQFINCLELKLQSIKAPKEAYIIGDFNINLLDDSNNSITFKNILNSHFFYPLITAATRVTSNTSSLIDNIFTNTVGTHDSGIIVSDFSDHFFIYAITNRNNNIIETQEITYKRKFTKKTIEQINTNLQLQNWFIIINDQNIESACNNFYDILHEAINIYAPLLKLKNKNKKQWVTKYIIKLSNKQNNLYKKSLINPSTKNINKYKKFRNYFTSIKHKTEQSYYNKKFMDAKHDIKQKWNIINNILNKKNQPIKISKIILNQTSIEEPDGICDALNNYYINITKTILTTHNNNSQNEIKHANNNNHYKLNYNIKNSIFIEPTNEIEINNIIKKLSNKKSISDDNLSNFIIKQIASGILTPLTHIFNISLSMGVFPNCFKTSKVIPIYKRGDREDVSNYRPISLLSPLSKILEKLMAVRMNSFFKDNKIINDNQYGFRTKHSTELAVIQFSQQILDNLNEKILTMGIFIDLSKAFDVIDHEILLQKLTAYGIRGVALSWFNSYLKDRYQYVTLDGCKSTNLLINNGVPQGSILGPLLFTVFINDLPKVSDKINFLLYADDTNFFFNVKDPHKDQPLIDSNLQAVTSWFTSNKLAINYSKSSYMIFGPKILTNAIPNLNLTLNNIAIPRVHSLKFLGVIIKDNLSWDLHISEISKKINKILGILHKIKYKINNEIMINLYYTMIYPNIIYCNLLWGNSPATHLQLISKCQNRFIRLLLNLHPHTHTSNYYPTLKILNIQSINKYLSSIFTFKFLHNLLPNFFTDFFIFNEISETRILRYTPQFKINQPRIKLMSLSIKYNGPRIWMTIVPQEIKNINSLHQFRNKLKEFLIMKGTFSLN